MTTTTTTLTSVAEKIINQENEEFDEIFNEAESGDQDNDYLLRLKKKLPKEVDIVEAIDYGFYEHKHRYWMMRRGDMFEPISNFTIKVLFLIVGTKRIVEIINVHRKTAVLDFLIEDLISIEKFKLKVESQGNFLFEGKATDLARIKNKLYNKEKASLEIIRLGTNKAGFWAWANGIYDGEKFIALDENGMVEWKGQNYYIPVIGSTQSEDNEDLRNYRKFVHRESNVGFKEWALAFVKAYGDNGKLGLAFSLYALFSDIIFDKTRAAPILFLFGERSSGKGSMASSILTLFGFPQDQLMLGGASTVVGFMRKLGQFANAITWLDEYKNDIGEKKIESMKNIWDRIGYERGVKDQSNRTQSTSVTSVAILSGQEMPNVEPALFSRTILLEFRNTKWTQQQIEDYRGLLKIEEMGITNCTHEIMKLREKVKEKFLVYYSEIADMLRSAHAGADLMERQIVNYSILITVWRICEEEKLPVPVSYIEILKLSEVAVVRQRDKMRAANEVQQFFEMIQFLITAKEIHDGIDLQIGGGLLKLRLTRIIPLYRDYSRRQGQKFLDKGTLMSYLENSEAFSKEESAKGSHRFRNFDIPTSATVFYEDAVLKLYSVKFSDSLKKEAPEEENEVF